MFIAAAIFTVYSDGIGYLIGWINNVMRTYLEVVKGSLSHLTDDVIRYV